MKCPNCGRIDENTKVIDSRPYKQTIRRRRECTHCKKRWNTYEVTEKEFESRVVYDAYKPWTKGEIKTAIKMRENGKTLAEICEVLGRKNRSVRNKFTHLLTKGEYFEILEEIEKC